MNYEKEQRERVSSLTLMGRQMLNARKVELHLYYRGSPFAFLFTFQQASVVLLFVGSDPEPFSSVFMHGTYFLAFSGLILG